MDIVGLGIKIVEQLVSQGVVADVADLYMINRLDLIELEGFAEKKAENLLNAIQASRNQPLARLINALGIRGVGEVLAGDLAKNYQDLTVLSTATMNELQTIEGVGPNIAQAIKDWFGRESNRKLLEKLRAAGMWPIAPKIVEISTGPGPLDGLSFVVTGTLPALNRDQVKEIIEENGGKVIESVSKKTSYLILGENPGSKYDKARSLNIPIIDESGLRSLIQKM